MLRNLVKVITAVFAVITISGAVFAGGMGGADITVGGHVKLMLFDRVNVGSYSGTEKYEASTTSGFSFKEFNLYISAVLSDIVSLELDPRFAGSTGATPKLGKTEPGTSSGMEFKGIGHGKGVIIFSLPYDVEVEFGILEPIFTVDYGKQMFWEDMMDGFKFACNEAIGAVHDQGFQIYKNFDIADVSLPVWLYIMNGGSSGIVDINNTPGVMLHVEPTYGPVTLLGSVYAARYDAGEINAMSKYAGGIMADVFGLKLRSEIVKSKEENVSPGVDHLGEGYYVQADYQILDWLRVFARHESAFERDSNEGAVGTRYLTSTTGLVASITPSTLLMFNLQVGDHTTSDMSKKLYFTRPLVGMRITF